MNNTIELIYKALETDQSIWLKLESSDEYANCREKLEDIYEDFRKTFKELQGLEGSRIVQTHEDLVNKLIDLSARYFFEKGLLMGIKLGQDVIEEANEVSI